MRSQKLIKNWWIITALGFCVLFAPAIIRVYTHLSERNLITTVMLAILWATVAWSLVGAGLYLKFHRKGVKIENL